MYVTRLQCRVARRPNNDDAADLAVLESRLAEAARTAREALLGFLEPLLGQFQEAAPGVIHVALEVHEDGNPLLSPGLLGDSTTFKGREIVPERLRKLAAQLRAIPGGNPAVSDSAGLFEACAEEITRLRKLIGDMTLAETEHGGKRKTIGVSRTVVDALEVDGSRLESWVEECGRALGERIGRDLVGENFRKTIAGKLVHFRTLIDVEDPLDLRPAPPVAP